MPITLFGTQILPPTVALFLTIGFVIFLFRRDFLEKPNITGALWIPLLWMLVICSRFVSQWLNIVGVHVGGASSEEGTPLDALFYFVLIAAGIYVLTQRGFNLAEFIERNGWLVAFLIYCFIAILWSDFPFTAFKHWIKILGLPIMALVVLTEPDLNEALARLMKRSAYLLVPFSILLNKYYPELGSKYDEWTGKAAFCGVTGGKNALGCVCMLLGLYFFWLLLQVWQNERSRERRNELFLITGFLLMIFYLLRQAHSATAQACLVVGILLVVLLGRRFVNKRMVTFYLLTGVFVLIMAELAFGISGYVLALLNRDPTLTTRTVLWAGLLKIKINPVFGVGFDNFWQPDRQVQFHANEAHNGYLETYLNLGLVGLFLLVAVLIATFRKARLELLRDFEWGRFRLAFFIIVLLYNCTEITFRGPHPLWFLFYIIAIEYPDRWLSSEESPFEPLASEEEMEDSPASV